jgi:hypothetical protein
LVPPELAKKSGGNIIGRATFPSMSPSFSPEDRDRNGPDRLTDSAALQAFAKALREAVGDTSEDLSVRMVELLSQLEKVPFVRRARW